MNILKPKHCTILAILLSTPFGYSSSFGFGTYDPNDSIEQRLVRPSTAATKKRLPDAPYKTDIVVEQPNSGPKIWYRTSNPNGAAYFCNDGSTLRFSLSSTTPRQNVETAETVEQIYADVKTIVEFTSVTPSEKLPSAQMMRLTGNTTPSKRITRR